MNNEEFQDKLSPENVVKFTKLSEEKKQELLHLFINLTSQMWFDENEALEFRMNAQEENAKTRETPSQEDDLMQFPGFMPFSKN